LLGMTASVPLKRPPFKAERNLSHPDGRLKRQRNANRNAPIGFFTRRALSLAV